MKMSKKIIISLIAFNSLIFNVQSQEIINFIPPYALPVTKIKINIVAVKTIYYPGPYKDYAEKYLGIKDVIKTYETKYNYELSSISIITEPDLNTLKTEFQKADKKTLNLFRYLQESGYIILPKINDLSNYYIFSEKQNTNEYPINTSLSVKRNVIKEKQIKEKKEKRDTLLVSIPIESEITRTKDLETKAEEAANFIIKIRKRLFKTVTGQENSPQGEAMLHAINTLKYLEEEYLSLFTGKKLTYYDTLEFNILVDKNILNKPIILFNFSEKQGITNNKNDIPFEIKIYNNVNNFSQQEIKIKNKNIKYRIPEKITIEIKKDNNKIFQEETFVFISENSK